MHEIGITVALGAQVSDVLKLVIGHGMKLTIIGIALGFVASVAITRTIKDLLFNVSSSDICVAYVSLDSGVTHAGYLPARRATKVEPLMAVRSE